MARIVGVWLLSMYYAWSLAEAATPQDVAETNGRFAFTLYRRLADTVGDNVFFSPLSISTSLGMVYVGAGGDTKDQMRRVLSFNNLGSEADINSGFRYFLKALDDPAKNYTLNIANRLFVNQTFDLQADYICKTQNCYKADVELMDFGSDPDGSREGIND